ncbi:hypothetical protein SQ03_01580 [Methylobacterium platani JCM 14648]|uniref:Uncharacterized protein n=3 Tax=Methylobacterium platani TaxID=427683 RepID=A0A179RXP4_9HYPH|nr:hypothetical protein SQ03_01580 [Methylobacterium platani JCM 14648]OAS15168.1 hypothetical protein A5481_29870 [Methylobacterium platani]
MPCIDGATGGLDLAPTAAYAWQTFIALNWPASGTGRGTPDANASFGEVDRPLVWETLRAKVETYPGNGAAGQAPHGVTLDAKNNPTNGPDFGFDDAPLYVYQPAATQTKDGLIPACPNQASVSGPAWLPLDETTQIGNNQTFAGAAPATDPKGFNSQPQLIRYAVKMNKTAYQNIVANRFWYRDMTRDIGTGTAPIDIAVANGTAAVQAARQAGQLPSNPATPFVNLAPQNDDTAVLTKSAWRPLSATEMTSGRFRTTTVRYYEQTAGTKQPCYREDVWGLVGMHVITYTRGVPWVIWSTFEQADNILTSDGKPTEDTNGTPLVPAPTAATTPALTSDPTQLAPVVTAQGPYCTSPGSRLFFRENPNFPGLPSGGNICLDSRWHALPDNMVAANKTAHAAITNANPSSVWQYYKLINVQPTPIDITGIGPSAVSTPASYYLSNSVIETDYSLGNFTGDLVKGVPSNVVQTSTGAATKAASAKAGATADAKTADPKTAEYYNTLLMPFQSNGLGFLRQPIRMGGCAGCHAYSAGTGRDFSFSIGQNVLKPDPVDAFAMPPAMLSNAMR